MRKEFSVIGAFSTAISFVAAVVLCLEISQTKRTASWQTTDLVLWSLEVAIFGIAVLLWRRRASLGGWIIGVVALLLVRVALSATCAFTASRLHPGLTYADALERITACEPRLAAALFATMIFYPLRALLPVSLFVRGRKETPRTEIEARGDASLWIVRGDEKLQVTLAGANGKRAATSEPAPEVVTIVSPDQFAGAVQVPLGAILPRIPEDYLTARAAQCDPSHPVSIPLSLIVPQLKEAQVFVRLEEIQGLLPPGALKSPEPNGYEGEPLLVALPLEEVVPLLPLETLELPTPSLPAWAELPDPEGVVFATALMR
jgi:hypothetical protein